MSKPSPSRVAARFLNALQRVAGTLAPLNAHRDFDVGGQWPFAPADVAASALAQARFIQRIEALVDKVWPALHIDVAHVVASVHVNTTGTGAKAVLEFDARLAAPFLCQAGMGADARGFEVDQAVLRVKSPFRGWYEMSLELSVDGKVVSLKTESTPETKGANLLRMIAAKGPLLGLQRIDQARLDALRAQGDAQAERRRLYREQADQAARDKAEAQERRIVDGDARRRRDIEALGLPGYTERYVDSRVGPNQYRSTTHASDHVIRFDAPVSDARKVWALARLLHGYATSIEQVSPTEWTFATEMDTSGL